MTNLDINGKTVSVDVPADTPLLWALRDELGLTGTKFGCGMALCGACTVHLDGAPIRSCVTPISTAAGKKVTTIEAIGATPIGKRVEAAWRSLNVPQCGYCQSGQIMQAAGLLATTPKPSDEDIDKAMAGNICRCGTYERIRAAIKAAAKGVAAVSAAAPLVQLDLRPSGTLDVFDHLDSGELDVVVGTFDAVGERFRTVALLEDRFVAVMRRGHPAGRGTLSAATFGALPHVAISSSGDDTGFIDRSLATRGARRRIALRLPSLAAAAVLGQSDMVATLSRRVAQAMVRGYALQFRRCCGTEGSTVTLPTAGCATSLRRSAKDSDRPPRSWTKVQWAGRMIATRVEQVSPCRQADES